MHPPALRLAALATLAAGAALLAAGPAGADDPFLRRTATVRAVEKVGPSVVNITTEQRVQGGPFQAPGPGPASTGSSATSSSLASPPAARASARASSSTPRATC